MASWTREPDRVAVRGTYFRQVEAVYPPLWHPGPRSAPATQPEARWHEVGQLAQYLSADTDGAWAELVRYEHLRSEDDRLSERRRLYGCAIVEDDIANLEDFDTALGRGIDPEILIDDDLVASRALANDLRAAEYRGLIAPSAALPGVVNLTLFDGRREVDHDDPQLLAHGNPRPDVWIPVQPIADDAAAPGGLLNRARLRGDPHLSYEIWKHDRLNRGWPVR